MAYNKLNDLASTIKELIKSQSKELYIEIDLIICMLQNIFQNNDIKCNMIMNVYIGLSLSNHLYVDISNLATILYYFDLK